MVMTRVSGCEFRSKIRIHLGLWRIVPCLSTVKDADVHYHLSLVKSQEEWRYQ